MKKLSLKLLGIAAVLLYAVSCSEPLTFSDTESPNLPELEDASAQLLWIGPEYKAAVQAELKDEAGISKIQLKNGEWQLDTIISADNQTSFTVKDTFLVKKDVNPTKHTIEIIITNSKGGIIKGSVDVEDLSAENQIEGYNPDLLPPAITVTKSPAASFFGFPDVPVSFDIEADITDEEIASIEIKVWGETAEGEPVAFEDIITPANAAEKTNYHFAKTYSLPEAKTGMYQYIVRAVDKSGNKRTIGNNVAVGQPVDRLYLSDAETDAEVAHQGYDHYGACRGIGTLISMKKEGTNVFTADVYYPNKSTDKIRFVAFRGSDRPFVKNGTNQAKVNYTLSGSNVIAMNASNQGKLTGDLSLANSKLPASQNGYYHVTVDLNNYTVSVDPYTPSLPVDAVKYPGWTDANPWPYMAVTGSTVVGTATWTEVATSPKLTRDADNKYLFTGTFQTNGSSSNMSLNAPMTANSDVWGKGWFRLAAGRSAMRDDYGDLVTKVAPVGPSSGGANWGFSTSPVGTYKASYDLILQRFRIVRTGN